MDLELGLIIAVLASACMGAGLYVVSRPTGTLITLVIVISIFVNLAGYSFLTYNAAGARRPLPGADVITYVAPLLLVAAIFVLIVRIGAPLSAYLRKNFDVLLLAGCAILSTIFSFDEAKAAQYSVWLAAAVVIALSYFYILGSSYHRLDWGPHLAGLLFIAYAPFLLLVVGGLSSFDGRLRATFSSKLFWTYSASVVIPAVLVISRRLRPDAGLKLLRNVPWLALASVAMFCAAVLLLSGKRNPIISTVLVMIVYLTLGSTGQLRSRLSSSAKTLILVAGIVLVGWQISPLADRTWARFEKLTDPRQNTSVQARGEIIENGIDVFKKYPVFGVGIANGTNAIRRFHPNDETSHLGLHNTVLGVLVETGLVGLFLYLVVSARSLYLLFKCREKHFRVDWLLLAIPPVLISITEYNLTPGQAMFWPLLLIVLAPRALLAIPEPMGITNGVPDHAGDRSRAGSYGKPVTGSS